MSCLSVGSQVHGYSLKSGLVTDASVEHGHPDQALQLFKEMLYQEIVPDHITLVSILTACADLHFLHR
ncbi:pentatricopeptide repeat-containing protein, partial [Trifolium medium]|nr:pentatricopeptide repeat-containing protein [Trifolium medium]